MSVGLGVGEGAEVVGLADVVGAGADVVGLTAVVVVVFVLQPASTIEQVMMTVKIMNNIFFMVVIRPPLFIHDK